MINPYECKKIMKKSKSNITVKSGTENQIEFSALEYCSPFICSGELYIKVDYSIALSLKRQLLTPFVGQLLILPVDITVIVENPK